MRARNAYEAMCLRMGAKALIPSEKASNGQVAQDLARGRNWTWGTNTNPISVSPSSVKAVRCQSTGTHGSSTVLDVASLSSYSLALWVFRTGTWSNGHMNWRVGWFSANGWFGLDARTSAGFEAVHGNGVGNYYVRNSSTAVPLAVWTFIGMSGTISTTHPDNWYNGKADNGTTSSVGSPSGSTPSGVTAALVDGNGHYAYGGVVFPRALTANEWARLYDAGRKSGLVAA